MHFFSIAPDFVPTMTASTTSGVVLYLQKPSNINGELRYAVLLVHIQQCLQLLYLWQCMKYTGLNYWSDSGYNHADAYITPYMEYNICIVRNYCMIDGASIAASDHT